MEDDDIAFGTAPTKRGAKTGRRAAPVTATPAPNLEEEELTAEPVTQKRNTDGPPGRPNKAVSGWGEDAPARKPRTRQLGEGFEALEEDALFSARKPQEDRPRVKMQQKFFDDEEDEDNLFRERLKQGSPKQEDSDSDVDIPVIPELEDQQEDEMANKIAAAPNIAVNRVATYRELDNDLLKQAAFLTLDNEIDLKLLTKALSPLEDLIEDDKPWEWDRLFTEVSSELRTEWEKAEISTEDDKGTELEQ